MVRGNGVHAPLTLYLHRCFRMESGHWCRVRGSNIRHEIRFVRGRDSMVIDVRMGAGHVTRHRRQHNTLWSRLFRFGIHHFRNRRPCVQILRAKNGNWKSTKWSAKTAHRHTSRRSSALFVLYGKTSISDRMCLARSKSPAAKLRLYSSRVTISNKSSISPRVNRGSVGSFDRIRCTSLMVSVTSIIACLACSFFRSAIVRGDTYEYNSFESGKTGGGRCICVIGGAARPSTTHCRCKTSETKHVTCFLVGHIFALMIWWFRRALLCPVRQLVRFAHNIHRFYLRMEEKRAHKNKKSTKVERTALVIARIGVRWLFLLAASCQLPASSYKVSMTPIASLLFLFLFLDASAAAATANGSCVFYANITKLCCYSRNRSN